MITSYLNFGYNINKDIVKLKDTAKLKQKAESANLTDDQTEAAIEVCTDTIAIELKNQCKRLEEEALEQIRFEKRQEKAMQLFKPVIE